MGPRIYIFCILVHAITLCVAQDISDTECPEGLLFDSCTSCPQTCGSILTPIPCLAHCVPGCMCPRETPYTMADRICGTREQCMVELGEEQPTEITCPMGQVFADCVRCQASCADPNPVCDLMCRPGCQCEDENHVLFPDRTCGPVERCAATECPTGLQYDSCGSPCARTCATIRTPMPCMGMCEEGCFCPRETPYTMADGSCGTHERCLVELEEQDTELECTNGRVFDSCGSCPRPCITLWIPIACVMICQPSCICPDNIPYSMADGSCGTRDQCLVELDEQETGSCPEGQVFSECVRCQTSCGNLDRVCSEACTPGCQCEDESHVVLPDRTCGSVEMCQEECSGDLVFTECGPYCFYHCSEPAICRSIPEGEDPCHAGCFCPRDRPYQTRDDRCFPSEQECPEEHECPGDLVFMGCGPSCFYHCSEPAMCHAMASGEDVCSAGCYCPRDRPYMMDDHCFASQEECPIVEPHLPCEHGEPLRNPDGEQVFCGRGVEREDCPDTHDCVIDEGDMFAVCCPREPEEPETQCPGDLEYMECGPSCFFYCSGPALCYDMVPGIDWCHAGCFCPSDRSYRTDDDRCFASQTECPGHQCPGDLEYMECGPSCFFYCSGPALCYDMVPGSDWCHAGCFCPSDRSYRTDDDRCFASETECPEHRCPSNLAWTECNHVCPPTCENRSPTCIQPCEPGCGCPRDRPILMNFNHPLAEPYCATVEECPNTDCPGDMEFDYCGGCHQTCGMEHPACIEDCAPACFCPEDRPISLGNNTCGVMADCDHSFCHDLTLDYETLSRMNIVLTVGDNIDELTASNILSGSPGRQLRVLVNESAQAVVVVTLDNTMRVDRLCVKVKNVKRVRAEYKNGSERLYMETTQANGRTCFNEAIENVTEMKLTFSRKGRKSRVTLSRMQIHGCA